MFVRCLAENLELLLFFSFNLYYCEILHIVGNAIIFCCRYQPVCSLRYSLHNHYYELNHPSACFQIVGFWFFLGFFLHLTAHQERWTETGPCVNTTFLWVMFWGLLSGIWHLNIKRVTQNNGVKKPISQTWAVSIFRIKQWGRPGGSGGWSAVLLRSCHELLWVRLTGNWQPSRESGLEDRAILRLFMT